MVQVAPIRLNVGPKVLWFDPAGLDICADDHVIVSTDRGHEYGVATSGIIDVSDELVANLKTPLKPVLRKATEEDEAKLVELEAKGQEALSVFKKMAQESCPDMHPVEVEFLLDGEKAVFFFEAEERVDFRDLVRRLASELHVRVDMRQIGVRDAARMVGGIGHCGQELCCRRMGGEFNPVTIRMAKEQGMSLNPQKISGCCGRLMCCLRYEFDTYKEFNSRAPKLGAKVDVPGGIAKVTDVSMPTETIALRLEDGKTIRVPLAEFEEPEPGRRPHVISEETYERYTAPTPLEQIDTSIFGTSSTTFTGEEKLADPNRKPRARKSRERDEEPGSSRSRRSSSSRKPRRRNRDGEAGQDAAADSPRSKQAKGASKQGRRGSQGAQSKGGQTRVESSRSASSHRRRRRRSSEGGADTPAPQVKAQQNEGGNVGSSRKANARKGGPRPGQKSSGLRNAQDSSRGNAGSRAGSSEGRSKGGNANAEGRAPKSANVQGNKAKAEGQRRSSGEHRKPRRRRSNEEGSSNASE